MTRLSGLIALANFLDNSGNLEVVKIPRIKGMPKMRPMVKNTSSVSS